MAFKGLHKGIPKNCDCTQFGSSPRATDSFVRRGNNDPAQNSDFQSYKELGIKRSGSRCKDYCDHSGVSIYQFNDTPEKKKIELKAAYRIRQTKEKFRYLLRVKKEAGLVWYQGRTDGHCNLLKSDEFSVETLDIFDVVDVSE